MENLNNYYFTFGSDLNSNVHHGGWVVISAADFDKARNIFNQKYGYTEDGLCRFAFQYTEEEFKATFMYKRNSNLGHGEWKD